MRVFVAGASGAYATNFALNNHHEDEERHMSLLKEASPDHPIHEPFVKRWSPYAFSGQPVPEEDLRALFEAARWSASNFNEQPWRYIVATRKDPQEFERLLSCLDELNQPWAKTAPVLALGCAAPKVRPGRPAQRHRRARPRSG